MSVRDEILFANEAFYRAFQGRSFPSMDKAWATKLPLLCIHPGAPPLSERSHVMASWREVLGHEGCPDLDYQLDRVIQHGELYLVTCYEWDRRRTDAAMVAANGYAREDGMYRMVIHHAGPVPRTAIPQASPSPMNVH